MGPGPSDRGLTLTADQALADVWLTVRQAAATLNLHPQTVRKFIRHGYLPCARYPSGQIRIPASAIARLLTTSPSR